MYVRGRYHEDPRKATTYLRTVFRIIRCAPILHSRSAIANTELMVILSLELSDTLAMDRFVTLTEYHTYHHWPVEVGILITSSLGYATEISHLLLCYRSQDVCYSPDQQLTSDFCIPDVPD